MSPVALSPPLAQAGPCRRRAHGRRLPPAWSCCASTTPSSFDTGRPSPPARAWEGGSPDVARLGMWDTPCLEGPSCCCIRGSVDTESLQRCEELYLQARASYFAGHPHVADDMFDKLESRLRLAGSEVTRKYPRCSLRSKQKYSDAQADTSQMLALTALWSALLLGGAAVSLASLPPLGHSQLAVPGLHLSGAAPFLAGAAVVGVAVRALQRLQSTTLVALKGDCPSCGEEVYAFVTSATQQPGVRTARTAHGQDCHVCGRPLRFEVRMVTKAGTSGYVWPWQRRAAGRITLVAEPKDFFPQ